MATKADISKTLAMFSTMYPNYRPADPDLARDMWYELLKDIPSAQLHRSVLSLLSQQREFAPTAGHVRAEWVRIVAADNATPDAATAWGQVIDYRQITHQVRCSLAADLTRQYAQGDRKALVEYDRHMETCQECGITTQETELHPLARKVAQALGWPGRFPGNTDDLMADRAHFLKHYDQARQTVFLDAQIVPAAANAPALPGITKVVKRLEGGHHGTRE